MYDRAVLRLRADLELRLTKEPLMRELSLKTERLSELTTDDLHQVAGAAAPLTIGKLCLSLIEACGPSVQACTTAISCGCQPTWNCA